MVNCAYKYEVIQLNLLAIIDFFKNNILSWTVLVYFQHALRRCSISSDPCQLCCEVVVAWWIDNELNSHCVRWGGGGRFNPTKAK